MSMYRRVVKRLRRLVSSDVVDFTTITLTTLLRAVTEASDAFPPLKSAAAGLNFLVENAQTAEANKADMESLLRRIYEITQLLETRPDEGQELIRRDKLVRELGSINNVLNPITKHGKIKGFIEASHTAELIQEYLRQIERALVDYQLSLMQDLYNLNLQQIKSDESNALDKLSRAKDAGFSASDYRSRCLPGTREDVLCKLRLWANDSNAKQIYYLNGHAGSGKSTIAQSFSELLFLEGKLGASFFCSRYSQSRSDVKMIFPTISFQLGRASHATSPKFRKAVLRTLEINPDIARLSLQNQLDELIVAPVKQSGMATIIVIDALDECRDEATTSIILSFLAGIAVHIPKIKFFITSRPEPHIRAGFRLEPLITITDVMILHQVETALVENDIKLFLEKKLSDPRARAERSDLDLPDDWPSKREITDLAKKASGLFIYASTAVKLILDKDSDPRSRLHALLSNADTFAEEGSSGLDTLYLDILSHAFSGKNEPFFRELRTIMGFLVVSCDLVPASTVAEILDISPSNVKTFLRSLHSVLLVPEDFTHPIRFHHKSFPDFLSNDARCKDMRFYVSRIQHNFEIAASCFDLMERRLRKNICGLPRYATNNSPGTRDRIEKHISHGTRYCCQYWADHLLLADGQQEYVPVMNLLLHRFLATRQLHWIEALSLLQNLHRAVDALSNVQQSLNSRNESYQTLLDLIVDGHKFILKAFDIISVSVAHIYHSALPFAPETSLLKSLHAEDLAKEATVLIGGQTSWNGPIRTIQGTHPVLSLEYSHGGTLLAGSGNNFSSLFRSETGEELAQLDSTTTRIGSLTFSNDDLTLATVSDEKIRIWDVSTGTNSTELQRSANSIVRIAYVAFHPHSNQYLVSRDEDGLIYLWDVEAQSCQEICWTVKDAYGEVCWLRCSGRMIILAACHFSSECIEMWDVNTLALLKTFIPPSPGDVVTAIASSRDGSLVASCLQHSELVIFDAASGDPVHHLSQYSRIHSLQFSSTYPDTLVFAAGSTLHVFYPDRATNCVTTLGGHLDVINVIAVSPDGTFIASGSNDHTINIWKTGSEDTELDKDTAQHSNLVSYAHFSADGQFLVSGSHDATFRLWDISSRAVLRVFQAPANSGWYGDDREPGTTRYAIILSDNLHVISCDDYGDMTLWNWRHSEPLTKKIRASRASETDFTHKSIFPYTHCSLGFFYCPSDNRGATRVECWTIATTDTPRIVLAAEGSVPGHEIIIGISYIDSQKASDITLVVECKSGKLLFATWRNARTVPKSDSEWGPTVPLHFVKRSSKQSQGTIAEHASTNLNAPCQLSDDEDWVIDERGRKILWVPPVNRGFGRWHASGKKLALVAKSGRLTLADFSRAKLDDSGPF